MIPSDTPTGVRGLGEFFAANGLGATPGIPGFRSTLQPTREGVLGVGEYFSGMGATPGLPGFSSSLRPYREGVLGVGEYFSGMGATPGLPGFRSSLRPYREGVLGVDSPGLPQWPSRNGAYRDGSLGSDGASVLDLSRPAVIAEVKALTLSALVLLGSTLDITGAVVDEAPWDANWDALWQRAVDAFIQNYAAAQAPVSRVAADYTMSAEWSPVAVPSALGLETIARMVQAAAGADFALGAPILTAWLASPPPLAVTGGGAGGGFLGMGAMTWGLIGLAAVGGYLLLRKKR
jgi:hypothetical protein